jgi:hypothetical protein
MPLDRTRVEELEAEIDDEQLSNVRFGRSNFLRNAGLALFGLSAGLFAMPREAAAAPPRGCSGAPECGSCRGARCRRCARRIRLGCRIYRCCDWINVNHHLCICRGFIGNVC